MFISITTISGKKILSVELVVIQAMAGELITKPSTPLQFFQYFTMRSAKSE